MPSLDSFTVGLVSDTHGLLRPEAIYALQGSDYIIHAGDIGSDDILTELQRLAPVTAVRGNSDIGGAVAALNSAVLEVGGIRLFVIHDICDASIDQSTGVYDVVVSGHTHKAEIFVKNGILFINPGSAGPQRSKTQPTVALLRIEGRTVTPQLIHLDV